MPDGGVTEIVAEVIDAVFDTAEFSEAVAEVVVDVAEVTAVAAAAYQSYEAGVAAREAYNASLRNRYVMQRASSAPRQLVLGRARVSGPIAAMASYGTNNTTLAIVVVLAAHQCDAIETIYFNDEPIILDSSNNVVGTVKTEYFSVNSSAPVDVMLAEAAIANTVTAVAQYADGTVNMGVALQSDGIHCTLTGGRSTGVASITLRYQPVQCQYLPNTLGDNTWTFTAASSYGTYIFPSNFNSSSYEPNLDTRVPSYQRFSGVQASSVVVTQKINGVQTALPNTVATDSNGNASSVSWTGATVGAQIVVAYQANVTSSRARVRQYLGAPGQVADAGLIANAPGMWTTNHVGDGICYLVVEMDYDQSSYSTGIPNVSATLRGAQIYDPRTETTAWSNNPAIMARGYWTHPLGAGQSSSNVDDASIIAAANVCDTSVVYPLGAYSYPRALYQGGIAVTKDVKPQDALTQITQAMGGRWVINGNSLRVRAGSYMSPVATIDYSWLTSESTITVQPLPPRQSLFNSAQGTFADETNEFRAVIYPKQISSALVTSDGSELPLDISYSGVSFSGQAQYLSAVAIRYARTGMTIKLSCNMKALPLEVFDVVSLTLPRFGLVSQTFEVTDTSFTPEGLITLNLKYIDSSIWAMDSGYDLTAFAPRTLLPSPWAVAAPTLGTPLTGAAQLLKQADGTIVSRIYVPLSITDVGVLTDGFIDVFYQDASDTSATWNSVTVSGDTVGTFLSPVNDGHTYSIKARARNSFASSAWTPIITCVVLGKTAPPSTPVGLTYSVVTNAIRISWTPCPDADYAGTQVYQGATFADAAFLGDAGNSDHFDWLQPAIGSYTVWVVHFSTSEIESTPVSLAVSVTSAMQQQWSQLTGVPSNVAALTGSEAINNNEVTISPSGTLMTGGGGGGGQVSLPALPGLLLTDQLSAELFSPITAAPSNDLQAAIASLEQSMSNYTLAQQVATNTNSLNAIITVSPQNGQIQLLATANVTTDVEARLTAVETLANADDALLQSTVSTVESQGATLTTQQTSITQLQNQIALTATEVYVDNAVSNATALTDATAGEAGVQVAQSALQAALDTFIDGQNVGVLNGSVAFVQQQLNAVASAQTAQASMSTALVASVANNGAAITAEQIARASGDAANASSIATVSASLGTTNSNVASVQTQANASSSAITGLESQYVMKVSATRPDGTVVLASIGLASTSNSSGSQSEIILAADTLAFVPSSNPNATLVPLFVAGYIDGVAELVINTASIGDATIQQLHLAPNAISTLYQNVTAGPVATGSNTG